MADPAGEAGGDANSPVGSAESSSALSLTGLVLVFSLALGWGASWPASRLALTEIPPWTYRGLGLIIGTAGLFAIAWARGSRFRIPYREIAPLALTGILNIGAFHIFAAYGLILMEAGRAIILAYTFPLWTVVLARFFLGERLTRSRLLGLALGLGAMAVLIGPEIVKVGAAPLGAVFVLCAAISWAAGTVCYKKFQWSIPTIDLAAWQMFFGAVPVVVGAAILETPPDPAELGGAVVLAVLYVYFVGQIYCVWAWFRALHLLPSAVAAIGTLLNPVVGVFSAAIILDEILTWREFTALFLVVVSIAIVVLGPVGFRAIANWRR